MVAGFGDPWELNAYPKCYPWEWVWPIPLGRTEVTKVRGRIFHGRNPRQEPRTPSPKIWRGKGAWLGWWGAGCSFRLLPVHLPLTCSLPSLLRFLLLPGPPSPLLPQLSRGAPFPLFFWQTLAPLGLCVCPPLLRLLLVSIHQSVTRLP